MHFLHATLPLLTMQCLTFDFFKLCSMYCGVSSGVYKELLWFHALKQITKSTGKRV